MIPLSSTQGEIVGPFPRFLCWLIHSFVLRGFDFFFPFLTLDFQADVLVSSVGASYQAIVNSGVPAMANPNIGDITVSPGLPLSNHVIHTNCCKWQGGQGEVVSTITM